MKMQGKHENVGTPNKRFARPLTSAVLESSDDELLLCKHGMCLCFDNTGGIFGFVSCLVCFSISSFVTDRTVFEKKTSLGLSDVG